MVVLGGAIITGKHTPVIRAADIVRVFRTVLVDEQTNRSSRAKTCGKEEEESENVRRRELCFLAKITLYSRSGHSGVSCMLFCMDSICVAPSIGHCLWHQHQPGGGDMEE